MKLAVQKNESQQKKLLASLTKALEEIKAFLLQKEQAYAPIIASLHPNYQDTALNFIHYLALRTIDLRKLQEQLSHLGLSSFGSSERYNMANINNCLYYLNLLQEKIGNTDHPPGKYSLNYFSSWDRLGENTQRLLGAKTGDNDTRIMVTLPQEASEDYQLVKELLKVGMKIARINCGHDRLTDWKKMIKNIRKAEAETGQKCMIYMDLAGPKLRTGPIKKERPTKKKNSKKEIDFLLLKQGEELELCTRMLQGRVAKKGKKKKKPARISVSLPSIINDVKVGHRILFDDGTIAGKILTVSKKKIKIKITQAGEKGSRLRGGRGINLPDSELRLPALTKEDLQNLPFAASHADIIGYSFVRRPDDVTQLQKKLKALGREDIGLVLKIETREAFDNLPQLLLTAMKSPNIGIMTARGDLAVEIGWERISEVQEEILWLCEAAHIPDIWATQVLERLAKRGVATRAEITDAAMAERAECVMLNKGPYIVEAFKMLDDILTRMSRHRQKRKGALRPLGVAKRFFKMGKTT